VQAVLETGEVHSEWLSFVSALAVDSGAASIEEVTEDSASSVLAEVASNQEALGENRKPKRRSSVTSMMNKLRVEKGGRGGDGVDEVIVSLPRKFRTMYH
jgi:hypothetical protein